MKKYLSLLALSSALLLTACGNDTANNNADNTADDQTEQTDQAAGDLVDGTYELEEANLDEHGWRVVFDIKVENGVITESNFDYVNEDGELKSEDENYQETMKKTDGVGPAEFTPALNEDLVEKQDPAEVEVITGATGSSEKFKEYAQMLVDAAKEGNVEKIVVQ